MKNPKEINEIPLFKNNHSIGILKRTESGCEILINENYEIFENNINKKQLTYQISCEQKKQIFTGINLPPYFAGLLPEGFRLTSLIKKTKTSEDDLFSLLIASGSDPIGDIHFSQNSTESTLAELPKNFYSIKKNLKSGETIDSKSIAGVQDKISSDRISLPLSLKKKNKNYILKLASDDYPGIIRNEMLCLSIARKCGIPTNNASLVNDENNEEALLVERFDREWLKDQNKWNRFHQEDACQFLNRYPADKYRIAFQQIATGIAQFATSPELEILNLLRLKAFSYLIGNGDLHAKNISLLQKGTNAINELSPAYDIICTVVYGDQKMALLFDGKNQNLKRKNFVEFGKRFDIPEKAILSMLNKLTKLFEKNCVEIFNLPEAKQKEKFLKALFLNRLQHLS